MCVKKHFQGDEIASGQCSKLLRKWHISRISVNLKHSDFSFSKFACFISHVFLGINLRQVCEIVCLLKSMENLNKLHY